MSGNKKRFSFLQLLRNLKYLSKFSLKELSNFSYQETLENFLYYIPNSNVLRPKICNIQETLEYLKTNDVSLARFGDGELEIINGKSIPYQEYDEKLAQRLKEILANQQSKLLVCINYWYFFPLYNPTENEAQKFFRLYSMPYYRRCLLNYIDLTKQYGDAGFTAVGQNQVFYDNVRELWNNKKIITIGCQEADSVIQYDIFDNAQERIKIFVSNKNAFREYNQVLEKVKSCYGKSYIIVLMCGPAGKVLAADFTSLGFHALDLGHLGKGYDFFKKGITITSETVKKFYAPDEFNCQENDTNHN